MSSDEFKEQLLQACRNIGNNLRTIGAALGLLGWLCTVAGCIMIWHHYFATTESTVIDNAVTNYYIILAFCVPILNLFAFLTEITIVHFLALGIFYANFAQFCATADFYTRADHGSSLAGGYSLLMCGEIISFFAIQELWRNYQAAKDRIREFAGLFSFMNCILLIIGCILMFYDSEQYSLLISIPPLLVADFYMVEHLFSILGLKYVVVTLTSPAAYYALSSSLGPNEDSQWKSGAAVVFASLVLMNVITVYRSIGSEDSKWKEKYYLSIQNFFENIRKVIPMAALGIGWVTAAIGTILLFVQSHNNQNLATDNYLFATMMFVPTLNWIGYLINAPLLHFTAVGLYYMAVGPYLAGGTTISGGSWQIDYLIAWIGATISFAGNLEAYKKFAAARERLVESVLRHPAFLLSCITSILILIGVIILFFIPEHGLLLLIDMDPLVLGAVYLIHAFVGITGIDYVLMFWAGSQLHGNSLVFALNSQSAQLQAGFSLIFVGLVLCLFVLTYKKIRIPDEAEPVPSVLGYEEL